LQDSKEVALRRQMLKIKTQQIQAEYQKIWARITNLAESADQYRKVGKAEEAFAADYESLSLWNKHFARTRDTKTPWQLVKPFPDTEYLHEIDKLWLREKKVLIPKSRRMLLTWRIISNNTWRFLVHKGSYIFLQSREMGDAGMDVDEALLWRVVWFLEHMPACAPGKRIHTRKRMQALQYPEMNSTIRAISADFDAFRSFGPTSIFADELAMQEHPEFGMTAAMPALEDYGSYTGVSTINGENHFWVMADGAGDEGATDLSAMYPALSKFKKARRNANGFAVVWPHYTCDPMKDPATEAGAKWYAANRTGMGDNDWRREYEIDAHAHVGKPIFPNFSENVHCIPNLEVIPGVPIYRGWDPGWGYSTCIFLQIVEDAKIPQVRIYQEVHSTNIDFGECRDKAIDATATRFPDFKGKVFDEIDIAALQHSQTSKKTAIDILGEKSINARYQKSGPEDRIILLGHLLANRTSKGEPAFLLDSIGCPNVLRAMRGLYRRKQDSEEIQKNEARHFIDAMGYPIYNNLWLRFQPKEKQKQERKQLTFLQMLNQSAKNARARYMSA